MQKYIAIYGKQMTLHMLVLIATSATSISSFSAEYKDPVGDSLASIEFIDDASQIMSIHFYSDAKECTDRTSTWVKQKEQRKLTVLAGKNIAFTVGMDPKGAGIALAFGAIGALGYKGCTPTLDFLPEAGRSYVFRMDSDGKDCRYKFYAKPPSESKQPEDEMPVTFKEREWFRAWGNSGPWCKKID